MSIIRRLAAGACREPANGDRDPAVADYPREVQHGRRRPLLRAATDGTSGSDLAFAAAAALQGDAGHEATERVAGPRNVARLFSLQHSAHWVRYCLVLLDRGSPPGFRHLTCAAARAAVEADARFGRRPVGGYRSLRRSGKASNFHCSVGGRGHEPKALHPVWLGCNDTTTQLGVLTSDRRGFSDRPCRPAKRRRLRRRDNPKIFRGFGFSWPLNLVIVAQSRCRVSR